MFGLSTKEKMIEEAKERATEEKNIRLGTAYSALREAKAELKKREPEYTQWKQEVDRLEQEVQEYSGSPSELEIKRAMLKDFREELKEREKAVRQYEIIDSAVPRTVHGPTGPEKKVHRRSNLAAIENKVRWLYGFNLPNVERMTIEEVCSAIFKYRSTEPQVNRPEDIEEWDMYYEIYKLNKVGEQPRNVIG